MATRKTFCWAVAAIGEDRHATATSIGVNQDKQRFPSTNMVLSKEILTSGATTCNDAGRAKTMNRFNRC
jgi:hypothetical protein